MMKSTHLRWLTTNLDSRRIPLNAEQRATRSGNIPYWGANCIVDYVDEALIDDRVVLIGEDGAPFLDPHKDVAFVSDGPIWPNNHIHILKVDEKIIDHRFLAYFLNQVDYSQYINGSTRQKLTQAQLGSIVIEYPALLIQRKVADFLDRETARIDQLVEKKQRLVAVLAEKKAAIVSRSITGSEFLSDEENPIMGARRPSRAARHLDITLGKMLQSDAKTEACIEIPYLRAASVDWDRIDISSIKKMWFSTSDVASYTVKEGDMVVLEGGDVGRAAFVEKQHEGFGFQNSIHRVRAKRGECIRFAFYWLMHMKAIGYFDTVCSKATLAHFTLDKFKAMPYPAIPESEQRAIFQDLDRQTSKIDKIVSATNTSIEKLREYRSSLVMAAVTGQIGVADWRNEKCQPDQPILESDKVLA